MQTAPRMFILCAWLEFIFYGINCTLYGGCVYVLLRKPHRLLMLASSVLFATATAHATLTFIHLLTVFTHPAAKLGVGGNQIVIAGLSLYVISELLQELLLIWRLYVLWNFRVCILPLLLWLVFAIITSCGLVSYSSKQATVFSHDVKIFGYIGWSLEIVINVVTTGALVYCLWRAVREISKFAQCPSYRKFIFLLLESGALIPTCTIIMFGLWAAGNVGGTIGILVAAQVSAMAPFLMIVCVGIGWPHALTTVHNTTSGATSG
ncbi:hypothetical protein DFH29DRAFT_934660 [Suillus ampliporus]|nr:hypothetical protein DFH29DRAFT_934660 [Suillus ampliporus]